MRRVSILSWPLVISFGLILSITPVSATPARLGSTNITSSLLAKVGALARRGAFTSSINGAVEASPDDCWT